MSDKQFWQQVYVFYTNSKGYSHVDAKKQADLAVAAQTKFPQ